MSQNITIEASKELDNIFGLVQENYFEEAEYVIAAIKFFHSKITAKDDGGLPQKMIEIFGIIELF